MSKKSYEVTLTVTMRIEVEQRVLDAVDDEFRKNYYDLSSEEKVVEHLAYNSLINNARLTQLDGFAHLSDEDVYWTLDGCEAEVEETS